MAATESSGGETEEEALSPSSRAVLQKLAQLNFELQSSPRSRAVTEEEKAPGLRLYSTDQRSGGRTALVGSLTALTSPQAMLTTMAELNQRLEADPRYPNGAGEGGSGGSSGVESIMSALRDATESLGGIVGDATDTLSGMVGDARDSLSGIISDAGQRPVRTAPFAPPDDGLEAKARRILEKKGGAPPTPEEVTNKVARMRKKKAREARERSELEHLKMHLARLQQREAGPTP